MRRILLSGPVLLGFCDLFDAAWGNPCPSDKMPTVTPTCLGGTLLPFRCPHCGAVRPQMADPRHCNAYRDPQRGFFWCPACRGRYQLDVAGMAPPVPLQAGARSGPCCVTVGGASWILDLQSSADDLDLLEGA